jgi:hypothetical protein
MTVNADGLTALYAYGLRLRDSEGLDSESSFGREIIETGISGWWGRSCILLLNESLCMLLGH